MEIITDFYSDLYIALPVMEEIDIVRGDLEAYPQMVTERISFLFDCPITLQEL